MIRLGLCCKFAAAAIKFPVTTARRLGLRLTFHPEQFLLFSSANPKITASAVGELDYQAEVAGKG